MEWRNLYKGLMIGATNVVPGLSSGTVALLLGIYDRLIFSINNLFSRKWKEQLKFLVPMGIGIVVATFLFANAIEWLFIQYPQQIQFAFVGLIAGALPLLFKESGLKQNFKGKYLILLIVSAVIAAYLEYFRPEEAFVITEMDPSTYLFLLFAGFVTSAAMILPGISGSLLLLLMGAFGTVINAVTEFHIDILVVVSIGIGLGVILMSKVISYLLSEYPVATYAVIIGLVIGSIVVIFPGWPVGVGNTLMSGVALLIGLGLAYMLGRVKYQEK